MKRFTIASVIFVLAVGLAFPRAASEVAAKADNSLSLDAKQQSIVSIAAFIANDNAEKLRAAFVEGLDTGLTVNEIKEIILHMSGYCGFPRSVAASRILLSLLEERQKNGIADVEGRESNPLPAGKTSLEIGTENQAMLTGALARPGALSNSFNPALDEYLRAHIFGDLWGRDLLDHKTRQTATVAALSSMRHTQLRGNMVAGFSVGLTEKDLEGIVTVIKTKVNLEAGEYAQGVLTGIVNERTAAGGQTQSAASSGSTTVIRRPNVRPANSKVPYVTLNNGVEMPIFGMGTYRITDLEVCERAVLEAIQAGYRLFDTAPLYTNEEAVGRAIKHSGVPREEFFITTKLELSDIGYENTRRGFEASLKRMGLDYIDLYIIHYPYSDVHGSWRAMEELYKEGKIRAIGISNFTLEKMVDITIFNEVPPAVNQIEIHPFYQRPDEVEYMQKNNVQPQGYSPLVATRNNILANETLKEIGAKYGKSVAQVILRWHIQRGVCVFPMSTNKTHIEENINIFDFELNDDDMAKIAGLDTQKSVYFDASDPEVVRQFRDFGGGRPAAR